MPNSSIATVGNCEPGSAVIRDIKCRILGKAELEAVFSWPLPCTSQIRSQQQRQRGSPGGMHRQGKARAPYEIGVKASIVSTAARAAGGHAAYQGSSWRPYDGHALAAAVIEGTEKLTGCEVERAYVEKRGVFGAIKRKIRRRPAIEAVIGQMKNDGISVAALSRAETVMPPTQSSPPPVTTSACS